MNCVLFAKKSKTSKNSKKLKENAGKVREFCQCGRKSGNHY